MVRGFIKLIFHAKKNRNLNFLPQTKHLSVTEITGICIFGVQIAGLSLRLGKQDVSVFLRKNQSWKHNENKRLKIVFPHPLVYIDVSNETVTRQIQHKLSEKMKVNSEHNRKRLPQDF